MTKPYSARDWIRVFPSRTSIGSEGACHLVVHMHQGSSLDIGGFFRSQIFKGLLLHVACSAGIFSDVLCCYSLVCSLCSCRVGFQKLREWGIPPLPPLFFSAFYPPPSVTLSTLPNLPLIIIQKKFQHLLCSRNF